MHDTVRATYVYEQRKEEPHIRNEAILVYEDAPAISSTFAYIIRC